MSEEDAETFRTNCTVCGTGLEITVASDKTYEGGHYFGEMEVPTEDAEVVERREEERGELGEITVVEYDEYETFEYWECDRCYFEDMDDE